MAFRRNWQLPAGLALTAATATAAVVLTVAHQPHQGAPQPSPVAQLTAAIRTAAQRHDDAALHRLLAQARTELQRIDSTPGDNPSLRNDLESLLGEVETLPQNAATIEVEQGAEEAIQHEDAAASPPPTEQPSPSPTDVPTPTEQPATASAPAPTDQPTSAPTPAPTDQPAATAEPTPDTTVTTQTTG